jgi:hypothetical protein
MNNYCPLWSVSRGETNECTFLISRTLYYEIMQKYFKTETSFVKSFIYIMYLYICVFRSSCVQKVSNKMSVNPYRWNVQLNSLYQIQCQAELNTLLCSVSCLFPLISCYLVAALELLRLKRFWKIILQQTVAIHHA